MKKKESPTLNFRIHIGVFYTLMMAKLGFVKRDKIEFAKRGVTEADITATENLLTEFSEIPTDDELLGLQINATKDKDKKSDVLRASISEVIDRAANKYGNNSGYYRQFGVNSLSGIDGGELSTAARRVRRVGSNMATELASEGLTPEMLATLKKDTENYDIALATSEDANSKREIATEDRIEKANAIYTIMSKYCGKGKQIWVSVNEAKFNDYVIYDTPSGTKDETTPPAPPK